MSPNVLRRNPESHRAILDAAYQLALELGPAKVTIEAIAARAGVGKQTIYRWWPSKGAVLLDTLNNAVGTMIDLPDTGDLLADLRTQLTSVAELFNRPDFSRYYTGLIAEAQSDPEVAAALADMLVARVERVQRQRLSTAQQRGQIRADLDVTTAVEMLYGPLYYRFLLHTAPLSAEHVDKIIDTAFRGLVRPTADKAPADVESP
ncbi:MAG TPA: TetR/AcrR family transcriptional regulator [Pseudonocardiaceae bacterium]|jgi:AcrR family transcriptional regulator|nr:TetR/AcrR family transcriptional regulator [Pseudonocardiaceae bacterium]